MTDRTRGNLFVTIQFAFLGLLTFVPRGTMCPSGGWVGPAGWVLIALGGGVLAIALLNLGSSLTVHPVPRSTATLKTTGMYAVVRHPIYLGLLVLALGLVLLAASIWHIVFFFGLSVTLHLKAGFEERLLRKAYPGYEVYASRVGRLVPKLSLVTRGSGER